MSRRLKQQPQDPQSGRFEAKTPFNDASTLDQAVRWVRAITELEPLLKGMHAGLKESDSPDEVAAAAGVAMVSGMLASLKASMVEALAVDPAEKRRALSPRVRSVRVSEAQSGELLRLRNALRDMGGDRMP